MSLEGTSYMKKLADLEKIGRGGEISHEGVYKRPAGKPNANRKPENGISDETMRLIQTTSFEALREMNRANAEKTRLTQTALNEALRELEEMEQTSEK